jgi:hypothetical protein
LLRESRDKVDLLKLECLIAVAMVAYDDLDIILKPKLTGAAQLSKVIAQFTAPAFLLSAVASLLSVLTTRLSRVVDRSRSISELSLQDARRASREGELPDLRGRGLLIHRAIFWSAGAGIVTCLLIIAALWKSATNAWLLFFSSSQWGSSRPR